MSIMYWFNPLDKSRLEYLSQNSWPAYLVLENQLVLIQHIKMRNYACLVLPGHSIDVVVVIVVDVVDEEPRVAGVARTTSGVAGTSAGIHQTLRHRHIQDTPLIQHLSERRVCVGIDYKHNQYIEVHL